MTIPPEYCTTDYWKLLTRRARQGLAYGAFLPNRALMPFPLERYGSDVDELAQDLVQQTYMRVLAMRKEREIENWHAFLRSQLNFQILSECKKAYRHAAPLPLCISQHYGDGHSTEQRELHLADPHALSPEQLLINDEAHAEQDSVISICRRHLDLRLGANKIKNPAQIEPFLEVVRRYLEQPDVDFDTHRQAVELLNSNTPSKANANRWWTFLKAHLTEVLPNRPKAATGENV